MKRTELARRTGLTADPVKTREFVNRSRRSPAAARLSRPRAVSPASAPQRLKVRDAQCLACFREGCDPMHLIDRSLTTVGQDDARAVVPACRNCHELYDAHELDLLPFLEPRFREELCFAVYRVGLMATVRRVTGKRQEVAL